MCWHPLAQNSQRSHKMTDKNTPPRSGLSRHALILITKNMYALKNGKTGTCDEKVKELFADKKRMEEEISHLRSEVVTLRVTARDYLKNAVLYQCSPWDLRVVRAYGIAKARMEEILSENVKDVAAAQGTPESDHSASSPSPRSACSHPKPPTRSDQ